MVARSENLDRTMEDTAANRESLGRTVEDTSCLMLLTRVGECSGGSRQSRVFRCKTCMQEFSSFQALAGHRASHNSKPIHNSSSDEQSSSLSSGSVTKKKTKKTRPHRCPICGLEFPMGQALGGHMTKHRNKEDSGHGGALVTRSFFPEATTTTTMFTTLKKPSSGKRVASLDLGSDTMDGMINLKLELGRTFT